MEIDSLNRVGITPPLNSVESQRNTSVPDHQLVSAVRAVNQSELLPQDRVLVYRRDQQTGQSIVQVINRGNGDVIDQIPMETLLRLQAEFKRQSAAKLSQDQDPYLA